MSDLSKRARQVDIDVTVLYNHASLTLMHPLSGHMRYIGGKSRIAKDLSPIILSTKPEFVVEPFCGALNVSVQLVKDDPHVTVIASDAHTDLIQMWQAIKDGWVPPENLTREEYEQLREDASSPLRTFAGYGCSFSGKWFGGYASDATGRNYCKNAHNAVMKVVPYLSRIILSSRDYAAYDEPPGSYVIYCDPPYAETTKPGARGSFDHPAFWRWVYSLDVPCYVSEYTAPEGTPVLWQKSVKTDMHTRTGKADRVEKLYVNHKE